MPDYTVGDTVYKRFTTRAFATGIPTTLAGAPVVSAYEDDSITQITAGITLGVDHDAVAGLNLLTIVATGANGYETGKSYDFVITAGTVSGVSVVGEVVWHLTLSAEAAAIDLANVTDGLGAIKTAVDDVPTTAEFNARTLVAASYFDPAADAVANVTLVATVTTVTGGALDATVAKDSTVAKEATLTARTLLAASYFDPAVDAVANVTLVATTTTLTGHTPQTTDHTAGIADIPTVAEFNARTLVAASYALEATVAALNNLSAVQVNAELLDVLTVDTFAEPAQGVPVATTTLATKIAFLYKAFRNLMTNDGTTIKLFNDDGVTVDQKAAVSEAAGTVTRGEFTTGP